MSTSKSKRPFKKSGTPAVTRPKARSVFLYTSKCCDMPATKDACERTDEDRAAGELSRSTLGTWNCSKCRRKCSVSRTVNHTAIETVEVAA